VEEILAGIWQSLLSVERVGRQDNFFELGGHSLLATQVAVHVRHSLSVELPLKLLFEHPTIARLAEQVVMLRNQHLLDRISQGDYSVQELLQRVTSMPESTAKELMMQLKRGIRS